MKNTHVFEAIERRSPVILTNTYGTKERIQAAYETWISERGQIPLLRVAKDMRVRFDMLVDYAADKIHAYYPEIQFPEKRQPIQPEYTIEEMARLESKIQHDSDNEPSFELFTTLQPPNKTRHGIGCTTTDNACSIESWSKNIQKQRRYWMGRTASKEFGWQHANLKPKASQCGTMRRFIRPHWLENHYNNAGAFGSEIRRVRSYRSQGGNNAI